MGARKEHRIPEPKVGMVIVENDPREPTPRRIDFMDVRYVYTSPVRLGGSPSRVSRKRLAEGRYELLRMDQ